MTLHDVTKLEEQLAVIDKQINELIEQRWKLVNPTPEEVKLAYEALTDDWYNQIGVMDVDNSIGRWCIPDEVVMMRRWELEKEEETA